MTERTIYAIGERRWWMGGGYDLLEGTAGANNLFQAWPITVAWFRERHHAEIFADVLKGKRIGDGEEQDKS